MIKIFDETSNWIDRVNFVDSNNVFVGYDLSRCCCEDAGWFISENIVPYEEEDDGKAGVFNLSDYVFDTKFFQDVPSPDLGKGGMVAFKLVADSKPDLYLHLFNAHNGYYGHGFEVKHGGETVMSRDL